MKAARDPRGSSKGAAGGWRGVLLAGWVLAGCAGVVEDPPLLRETQRLQSQAAVLYQEGSLPAAAARYREVLELARVRDDRPAMTHALIALGRLALIAREVDVSRGHLEEAVRLAEDAGLESLRLQARFCLAEWALDQGRLEAAGAGFKQIVAALQVSPGDRIGQDWSDPADRVRLRVQALNGWALVETKGRRPEQALELLAKAEPEARALGEGRELAGLLLNRAQAEAALGRLEAASVSAEQALRLDRLAENLSGIAADLVLLGQLRLRQGDAAGAEERFKQARHIRKFLGVDR